MGILPSLNTIPLVCDIPVILFALNLIPKDTFSKNMYPEYCIPKAIFFILQAEPWFIKIVYIYYCLSRDQWHTEGRLANQMAI